MLPTPVRDAGEAVHPLHNRSQEGMEHALAVEVVVKSVWRLIARQGLRQAHRSNEGLLFTSC